MYRTGNAVFADSKAITFADLQRADCGFEFQKRIIAANFLLFTVGVRAVGDFYGDVDLAVAGAGQFTLLIDSDFIFIGGAVLDGQTIDTLRESYINLCFVVMLSGVDRSAAVCDLDIVYRILEGFF